MGGWAKGILSVALLLLAVRCDAGELSRDDSIARWTERALASAKKVADPEKRTKLAKDLAMILARQGKTKQALAEGAQLIDKKQQNELISSICCEFLDAQDAIRLIETLTSQAEKDAAYYEVGSMHAANGHAELATALLKRISPDHALDAWLYAASTFRSRDNYEIAMDFLNKATPRTDEEREKVKHWRRDIAQQRRRYEERVKKWAKAKSQDKELDLAKQEVQEAADDSDKVEGWLRVADIQRDFGWQEEYDESLTNAEYAADEIDDRHHRAMALERITVACRRGENKERSQHMMRKCLAASQKCIVGNNPPIAGGERSVEIDRIYKSIAASRVVNLLILLGDFEAAVGVAQTHGQCFQLGYCVVRKDAATLALLEARLNRFPSDADQADIALGVASALQDQASKRSATQPE